MYRPKKKVIDGIEYMVIGSTINYAKVGVIHSASWTTTKGKVTFEKGKYTHPETKVGES